jgi:hypothetical protein
VALEQDHPAVELIAKNAPQIDPAVARWLNQKLRRRGWGDGREIVNIENRSLTTFPSDGFLRANRRRPIDWPPAFHS